MQLMGIASLHPSYALVQGKRGLPPRSKNRSHALVTINLGTIYAAGSVKVVQCANVSSEAITIAFLDQSLITISLRESDYRGPEAALLHGSNGSVIWVV
jgi:hypothetical protein